MKIYERVVIDIGSGEILEEESFDYGGPVAWCGGSGGGGGGGDSGKVDYPEYMKDIHENWLRGAATGGGGAAVDVSESLTALVKDAIVNSPFSGRSAYDVSTRVSNIDSAVSDFSSYISNMDNSSNVESEISGLLPSENKLIDSVSAAFDDAYSIVANGLVENKLSARNNLANLTVESNRISIVAESEENAVNRKIAQKDSLWPLQIYQSGANVMASISGATMDGGKPEEGPSDTQKAIGGGLSGAAAGAAIGSKIGSGYGWQGALIGGLVGAGAALARG